MGRECQRKRNRKVSNPGKFNFSLSFPAHGIKRQSYRDQDSKQQKKLNNDICSVCHSFHLPLKAFALKTQENNLHIYV